MIISLDANRFFFLSIYQHLFHLHNAENRVYMKIKVNPLDPTFLVTTFYGPTRLVERYRTIYSEKVNDWNADDDIHGNFLKIFGKFALIG